MCRARKDRFWFSWRKKPVRKDVPHAYALAILTGLAPKYAERFVDERLVPLVAGHHDHPVQPTPFFMYYILEALKARGRTREVIDCIERWWGGMLERGLTTCEEHWNTTPGQGSLCHAWSAHPIVHLSNIMLGVWQTAPAWKKIRFAPTFTGAEGVSGKVATPRGVIESSWELSKGKAKIRLAVPKGVSAAVEIPGLRRARLRGPAKKAFTVALSR